MQRIIQALQEINSVDRNGPYSVRVFGDGSSLLVSGDSTIIAYCHTAADPVPLILDAIEKAKPPVRVSQMQAAKALDSLRYVASGKQAIDALHAFILQHPE